ncbi:MAG: tyrosine-protein phosphatase [Acidimicrobiales bacterium]
MELRCDGLINGRDLAGMRIATGAAIKPGRLVRSGSPTPCPSLGGASSIPTASAPWSTVVNLMLDREIASNLPLAPEAVPGDLSSAAEAEGVRGTERTGLVLGSGGTVMEVLYPEPDDPPFTTIATFRDGRCSR